MIGTIGQLRIIQILIIIGMYLYLFFCIEKKILINKFFLTSIILIIFTTNVIGMDSITYRHIFLNAKFQEFEFFFRYANIFFRKYFNFYLLNLFLGVIFLFLFDKIIILNRRKYKRIYFLLISLFFINGLLNTTRAAFGMCVFIYLLSIKRRKFLPIVIMFHYSSFFLMLGDLLGNLIRKFIIRIKNNRIVFCVTLILIFLLKEIQITAYETIINLILDKESTIYLKIYNYSIIKDKSNYYNILHEVMRTTIFLIEPLIAFVVIWLGLKKENYSKFSELEKRLLAVNILLFYVGMNFIFLGKMIFGSRIIGLASLSNIFLIDKLFKNLFYIGILGLVIIIFYILYTLRIFQPGSIFYIL